MVFCNFDIKFLICLFNLRNVIIYSKKSDFDRRKKKQFMFRETKICKYCCFILFKSWFAKQHSYSSISTNISTVECLLRSLLKSGCGYRVATGRLETSNVKTFVSAQSSILPTNEKWYEYRRCDRNFGE